MLKLKDKKHYIAAFALPVMLMAVVYMANGILTQWSVITNDLNSQYVNFLLYYRNNLGQNGLFYSFSKGLGGNFYGIFTYYLASPLNLLVFLFPSIKIESAITFIMFLRTGLASAAFCWFADKKVENCTRFMAVVFGTVYAMCSYLVVISYHIIWSDAFFMLPVVMVFLMDILEGKPITNFVIAFSLLIISNYYMAYMVGIFCAVVFIHHIITDSTNLVPQFLSLAKGAVLSVLLTVWVLVPSAFALMQGKTAVPDDRLFAFGLGDILPKLYMASYDSLGNISAPFVYCGGAAFVIFAGIVFLKNKSVKEKIADIAVLAVFGLSFWLVPLGKVWHMFSATNSFPYRFTYIFVFFILWKAVEVCGNFKNISAKPYAVFTAVALAAYVGAKFICADIRLRWMAATVMVIAVAVVCLFMANFRGKKIFALIFGAVMLFDMTANGIFVLGQNYDALLRQPKGSIARVYTLVEKELEKTDTESFYRIFNINNDYNGIDCTENSNFRHGFNDITRTFTSLSEKEFEALRYGDFYKNPRQLIMAVTGGEYYLNQQQLTPFESSVFPLIYKTSQTPTEQSDLAVYIKQVTGCDVLGADGEVDIALLNTAAETAQKSGADISFDGEGRITAVISGDSDNQFVATTIVYDDNWHIKVNGKRVENQRTFGHFTAFEINSGENIVEMTYIPKAFYPSVAVSALTFLCCVAFYVRKKKI